MLINADRRCQSQGQFHWTNFYCKSWQKPSAIFIYRKTKKMDKFSASCFGLRIWDPKGFMRPKWLMGLEVVPTGRTEEHSGEGGLELISPCPTAVSGNCPRCRGSDRQTKNLTQAITHPYSLLWDLKQQFFWFVKRKKRSLTRSKFCFINKKN